MVINPEVINKIKKIVFTRAEPHDTTVMWAKPFKDNFTFFIYDNGAWQALELYDNVEISILTGDISVFENDAGYITSEAIIDMATKTWVNNQGYLTQHQDLTSITSVIPSAATPSNQLADKAFVNAAIPSFTSDEWAAIQSGITSSLVTSFEQKYDKPSGGIPSSDMSSAVRTSLGKADTALQEHQDISGKADKADLGTAAGFNAPASGDAGNSEVVLGSDSRLTDSRTASDVYPWAKATSKPSYTYNEIGNTPDVWTKTESDGRYAIKDISIDGPLYIGAGLIIDDVIDDPSNRYDDLTEEIVIGCVNDYMWFIWPSSNTLNVEMVMSGFPVPMSVVGTETIDNVEYTVIRSDDTYDFIGTLKIRVVQQTV